jgi:hypothetical protein
MVTQPEPLDITAARTRDFLASAAAVAELYDLEAPTVEHFDETFAVRINAAGITLFGDTGAAEPQMTFPWNEIESIDHGVPNADVPRGFEIVGAVASSLVLGFPLLGWDEPLRGILLIVRLSTPGGSVALKIPVPDEGGLPIPGAVAAVARRRPRGTRFQVPPELRHPAPRR